MLPVIYLYEVGLATVRRVKGLEYRCVAIVNCNEDQFPSEKELAKIGDISDEDDFLIREINLLYVAMTRARDNLYISHTGPSSMYLDNIEDYSKREISLKFSLFLNVFLFVLPNLAFSQEINNKEIAEQRGIANYLIDLLLSIFRNDNTALFLAGIMIILSIILIIDYRQRISAPVINDLKNINNLFSKLIILKPFQKILKTLMKK